MGLSDTREPYERAMLDELLAMTWRGPVTAEKIQRRFRVGFVTAARLADLYHQEQEAAS